MPPAQDTTLLYRLQSRNPYDTFDEAQPWQGSLGDWRCVLQNRQLTAAVPDRLMNVDAARASLEPMLRAWETAAFLRDQYDIAFRFAGTGPADDRVATSGGVGDAGAAPAVEDDVFRRNNTAFPPPDGSFTQTPLVDELLEAIRRFRQGQEMLPVVAGQMLSTMAATLADPSGDISAAFAIDPDVVDTLSELSRREGASTPEGRSAPTYRGPEWQWMQEAIRLFTLQAGRREVGAQAALSMNDFRSRL